MSFLDDILQAQAQKDSENTSYRNSNFIGSRNDNNFLASGNDNTSQFGQGIPSQFSKNNIGRPVTEGTVETDFPLNQ